MPTFPPCCQTPPPPNRTNNPHTWGFFGLLSLQKLYQLKDMYVLCCVPPPKTQVATPEQAQEVHAYLRSVLSDRLGRNPAENTRIIYGGSVNDGNCNELATQVIACVCVYLCVWGGGALLRCVR